MYGRHPPSPLGSASDLSALGDQFSEAFASVLAYTNHLSAVHDLVASSANVATLADAAQRDRRQGPPRTFKPGQLVLVHHPATTKWAEFWRGPFQVVEATDASWYKLLKLQDVDSDVAPTTVYVSRMRAFNATRTTTAKLLARVAAGYGVDTDQHPYMERIDAHRTHHTSGEIEFSITWHNDTSSWVTAPEWNLFGIRYRCSRSTSQGTISLWHSFALARPSLL